MDSGFYAVTLADERRVPELYLDQLIAIEEITADLDTVADDEREAAAEAVTAAIAERHGGEAAGIVVETVSLWNGAKTSAYVFRRFDDVRVVMVPELQLGFFGGDPDNFTYPRYALDMSFLRVSVDDKPYRPEVFFRWSVAGVQEGDPVFVIGNPGSTNRLQAGAQLEYRRDIGDRALVDFLTNESLHALHLWTLVEAYAKLRDTNPFPLLSTGGILEDACFRSYSVDNQAVFSLAWDQGSISDILLWTDKDTFAKKHGNTKSLP